MFKNKKTKKTGKIPGRFAKMNSTKINTTRFFSYKN